MFPTSQIHIQKVREVFDKYDADKNGAIELNELAEMFQKISNRLTALPAVSPSSSGMIGMAAIVLKTNSIR